MVELSRLLEVIVSRSVRVGIPLAFSRIYSDPIRQINREFAEKIDSVARQMREEGAPSGSPKANLERMAIPLFYCGECLERHFSKAHGLLEEAERFSLKSGKITPEAADKVRKAVEELVTSEDDIDNTQAPLDVQTKLDEIRSLMRDVRKEIWNRRLSFEGTPIAPLRELKAKVDKLTRLNYSLMAEFPMAGSEPAPGEHHKAEREALEHLKMFEQTEDISHLKNAMEVIKTTSCKVCVKYTQAAMDAIKEGKREEALGWSRGVRRGISALIST